MAVANLAQGSTSSGGLRSTIGWALVVCSTMNATVAWWKRRSVRQGSVEVDGGVRAVAERLVGRVPAAAHRIGIGVLDLVPVRGDEAYRTGDDVGTVFARSDGDFVGHGRLPFLVDL